MVVIPAIDVKDGRCVRLRQGDMAAETVYSADVPSMARRWEEAGAGIIHLVDLNGAVEGEPKNFPQIEAVRQAVRIELQVGGGIRNLSTVRRYLDAGISRIVLGTAAVTDRPFLDAACREFPRRILLGVDARNGKVAVKGWTSVSETTAIDLLKDLSGYPFGAVIYTDIARDGMLEGPNLSALKEIAVCSPFPVIASGGISRTEDLKAVRSLAPQLVGAIVGKALYDGTLDYRTAVAALREGPAENG
jgi:phosphoribosylformimino-5-aminoimidazole carboxamide ribotide isomerase